MTQIQPDQVSTGEDSKWDIDLDSEWPILTDEYTLIKTLP